MTRCVGLLVLILWLAGCCSPPAAAQASGRSVEHVRATGSLRGTDLDGDWIVSPLRPDSALLHRFDHLLTAVGETGLPEMRQWIEREVTRQRDATTASQVLAAWDEHLAQLQGKPAANPETASNPDPIIQPARPPSRAAVVAPRGLLAPEPRASAEQLQALQAQRVAAFGAEAAERLRAEDALRWAWAQRLAQARAQWPTLPAAQRAAYLARQFSGAERLRARTLLGLPP